MQRGLGGGGGCGGGDKGGGGMGKGTGRVGYRQDYRQSDRNGYMERGGGGRAGDHGHGAKGSSASGGAGGAEQLPGSGGGGMPGPLSEIERQLQAVQQDFSQELRKINEKENEKFDLIFAILTELQGRQAQLEDSVRSLKGHYGNGQMMDNAQMMGQANVSQSQSQQQQQQGGFVASNGQQSYNQMGGSPMMNGMNNQQPMQQFTSVMQPDGTQAMFTAMPQVVVVQSPAGAGMQYAMPQMMSPTGAMQPMQQVAMQFIGQGPNQESNGNNGGGFAGAGGVVNGGCASGPRTGWNGDGTQMKEFIDEGGVQKAEGGIGPQAVQE